MNRTTFVYFISLGFVSFALCLAHDDPGLIQKSIGQQKQVEIARRQWAASVSQHECFRFDMAKVRADAAGSVRSTAAVAMQHGHTWVENVVDSGGLKTLDVQENFKYLVTGDILFSLIEDSIGGFLTKATFNQYGFPESIELKNGSLLEKWDFTKFHAGCNLFRNTVERQRERRWREMERNSRKWAKFSAGKNLCVSFEMSRPSSYVKVESAATVVQTVDSAATVVLSGSKIAVDLKFPVFEDPEITKYLFREIVSNPFYHLKSALRSKLGGDAHATFKFDRKTGFPSFCILTSGLSRRCFMHGPFKSGCAAPAPKRDTRVKRIKGAKRKWWLSTKSHVPLCYSFGLTLEDRPDYPSAMRVARSGRVWFSVAIDKSKKMNFSMVVGRESQIPKEQFVLFRDMVSSVAFFEEISGFRADSLVNISLDPKLGIPTEASWYLPVDDRMSLFPRGIRTAKWERFETNNCDDIRLQMRKIESSMIPNMQKWKQIQYSSNGQYSLVVKVSKFSKNLHTFGMDFAGSSMVRVTVNNGKVSVRHVAENKLRKNAGPILAEFRDTLSSYAKKPFKFLFEHIGVNMNVNFNDETGLPEFVEFSHILPDDGGAIMWRFQTVKVSPATNYDYSSPFISNSEVLTTPADDHRFQLADWRMYLFVASAALMFLSTAILARKYFFKKSHHRSVDVSVSQEDAIYQPLNE
eukprot:104194_1